MEELFGLYRVHLIIVAFIPVPVLSCRGLSYEEGFPVFEFGCWNSRIKLVLGECCLNWRLDCTLAINYYGSVCDEIAASKAMIVKRDIIVFLLGIHKKLSAITQILSRTVIAPHKKKGNKVVQSLSYQKSMPTQITHT